MIPNARERVFKDTHNFKYNKLKSFYLFKKDHAMHTQIKSAFHNIYKWLFAVRPHSFFFVCWVFSHWKKKSSFIVCAACNTLHTTLYLCARESITAIALLAPFSIHTHTSTDAHKSLIINSTNRFSLLFLSIQILWCSYFFFNICFWAQSVFFQCVGALLKGGAKN